MPNNKGKKRGANGSKNARKSKRGKAMPSALQILPRAFKRTYLAYVDGGDLIESAAGAGTYITYRLNSVYDPNFTGVGTTAVGYTDLSTMFGLFRVVRARVILRWYLVSNGVATVGFLPGPNSTFTSSLIRWECQPNAMSALIQGNTGGARSVATFDRIFDLAQLAGLTAKQYQTDMDFAHLAGANPARGIYGTVYFVGRSASALTAGFSIRIIYELEVSNPLQTLTS